MLIAGVDHQVRPAIKENKIQLKNVALKPNLSGNFYNFFFQRPLTSVEQS